jgi:hypothetical protein
MCGASTVLEIGTGVHDPHRLLWKQVIPHTSVSRFTWSRKVRSLKLGNALYKSIEVIAGSAALGGKAQPQRA